MRVLKPLKKFFEQCDMFSAPATFRIRDDPQMKSFTMGILSFMVACFFVYVFINSSVKVFNYENISFSQSSTTIRSNETNGNFQTFAVTFDFMDIDEFFSTFSLSAYLYKNGTKDRQINLRLCTPEDWTLLGQNYKDDFYNYYIDGMFCPDIIQQYYLNDTFRSDTPSFVAVYLQSCSVADPNCNITQAEEYLNQQTTNYGSASLWAYVLDKSIVPDKKDPISYFINIDTRAQISNKFGGAAVVQFANFQIDTDMNVFPWEQKETKTGCKIDTVRTYQIGFDNITTDLLGVIRFTLNQKKLVVSRKVGKLDQLLSYAGGLFSLIIGFLAFFLQSYNEYKYELLVAESSFNLDQSGNQSKEADFLFWHYVQYTIFDWINLLCCCAPKWQKCIKIDETREKVVKQLQTNRLIRRLSTMERSLKTTMDLNENILTYPAIEQVEEDIKIVDYYNQITHERCALTLSQFIYDENQNQVIRLGTQKTNETKISGDVTMIEVKNVFSISSLTQNKEVNTSQLRIDGRDRLSLLSNIMIKYPQIKSQSQSINLSQQFDIVQQKIATSFFKLNSNKRRELQQKIPVIILMRLKQKGMQLDLFQNNAQI